MSWRNKQNQVKRKQRCWRIKQHQEDREMDRVVGEVGLLVVEGGHSGSFSYLNFILKFIKKF